MMDNEPAFKEAVEIDFPNCHSKGCLFHTSQSHYRKLQALGLQTAYSERNGEFALWAKSFTALSFVPMADIVASFHLLCRHPEMDPRLTPFMEYIEEISTEIFSFSFTSFSILPTTKVYRSFLNHLLLVVHTL
jgi:hypothetical protein